ncbi:hypothetical protein QFZ34_001506 [Phyllobacterium ifriqiyense]|uniref:Uncharacterized protein n=1 Tax=Phyllobacterium ifriqiyense TaxID=314238 RepID=A0ABU0S6F3_9HYPH|nr:hypothetical protein [Phyllobacterium ifriqiyense]
MSDYTPMAPAKPLRGCLEITFCKAVHRLGCQDPIFIILAEQTIASESSEAAFHDPGQASDLEGTLRRLDDLQLPALLFCQGAREFLALVACIGDHRCDHREDRCRKQAMLS